MTTITSFADKTALVTGATSGIGFEVAKKLAADGVKHLIIVGRDDAKTKSAAEAVKQIARPNTTVEYALADFASLQSVKDFATLLLKRNIPINLLINNAGVVLHNYSRTQDGFEATLHVNHLSPFLLTVLLLPLLKKGNARIVNVSSSAHLQAQLDFDLLEAINGDASKFIGIAAYSTSKLLNVLFTKKLQQLVENDGLLVNSLCPGAVNTGILEKGNNALTFDEALANYKVTEVKVTDAATFVVEVAKQDSKALHYTCYTGLTPQNTNPLALDQAVVDKTWQWTESLVAKYL